MSWKARNIRVKLLLILLLILLLLLLLLLLPFPNSLLPYLLTADYKETVKSLQE